MITPSQQRRVRELFEAVVDRDPADALAWIDREAADDPAVRDEVRSLLDHHSRAGSFLADPIVDARADLLDDEPLAAGTIVGAYTIVRELGRGGMGRVYLARDAKLGRHVALKALAPHFVRDARQRERLRREARAAAGLAHPGVCTVYALEEIGDEVYIATEFIDGHTLRDEIDANRRPSTAELLDTARQLAAALAAAHARGIVHRDLKPENIMRGADGRLKILDFGLARSPAADDLGVTLTGIIAGTPAYMAPEQRQRELGDARADVFAYGVVMYEYACGTHPVRATAPLTLPPPLGEVIGRCVREAPAERFASAAEIVNALEQSTAAGRSPGWWRIHQLVVIALYVAASAWAWRIKDLHETPLTVAVFVALTAVATIGGVLRGHLVFTSSFNRARLSRERRRTSLATLLVDLAFALLLFVDAIVITPHRALAAVIALSLALGIALAAIVLEPATTAAAFGEGE